MGVAMKQKLRSGRCMARRDMDQMKTMAETLKLQTHRPVWLVVLISPNDGYLGAEILNRF